MTDETMNNNWWEWDKENERFSFQKTEDYLFGEYVNPPGKRIGDMTREELIHVIATGYYERERLANALLHVVSSDGRLTMDISIAISIAKNIVTRLAVKP